MEDRRKHIRITYFTEVQWGVAGAKYEGKISDISAGGAYVDSIMPCPERTIITVKFKLPEGQELSLQAVVKNSTPGMGMGVEFINLRDIEKELLSNFVKEYS